MTANSKIQWTDHTFNPWRGCSKVSAGCKNCYAETLSHRNPGTLGIWGTEAQGATRVLASEAMWKEPLNWEAAAAKPKVCCTDPECDLCEGTGLVIEKRPRVFCASLADVFEDWGGPVVNSKGEQLFWQHCTDTWIDGPNTSGTETPVTLTDVRSRLFRLIDSTPSLDWLLLTKRPDNIPHMWPVPQNGRDLLRRDNVWLGVSVENQDAAHDRINDLIKVAKYSPVRFLSCEPLLERVDLTFALNVDDSFMDANLGWLDCIDWVIAGGESGPNARPCNVEWIRSLRDQCCEADVPFFNKQLGSRIYIDPGDCLGFNDSTFYKVSAKKGERLEEWPDDLRVRQFPNVPAEFRRRTRQACTGTPEIE